MEQRKELMSCPADKIFYGFLTLRYLKLKDAPLMLEWMHDPDITKYMRQNFSERTLADCRRFIMRAKRNQSNLHLAITDDKGEYLGTVSLKHIKDGAAEFGIVLRKCAHGTGIANDVMKKMLQIGFGQYDLRCIYWCVDQANARALHFYDKNGYKKTVMNSTSPAYKNVMEGGGTGKTKYRFWSGISSHPKPERKPSCNRKDIAA